ncbi:transcription regulator protein BACH1b isoform X2 [Parambassis ranga]|nr:transcription regulator protein BACH1-like isoform X2 [Parambassis ranga]
MSLMVMSIPRSSVFTFESKVHSSHVLLRLDEQRRRDTLCDVTVVVEGQSFRAHRSVLASCSEYFTQRISSLTDNGTVVTLPEEVTVAGFEPLLKFAYTSKLLFGKHDVLDIQNSASILGFRDLDESCFEFLLPKFLSSSKGSAPFLRKTCCKTKCKRRLSKENRGTDSEDVLLDDKEAKPVADSPSHQEVVWDCNKSVNNNKIGSLSGADTLVPLAKGTKDYFMQCPKYRKFQLACGKESCVTEKSLTNPVMGGDCVLKCLPCSSSAKSVNETEVEFPANSNSSACTQKKGWPDEPLKPELHDMKTKNCMERVKKDKEREGRLDNESDKMEDEMEHITGIRPSDISNVSSGPSTVLGERSPGLILHHCPLRALNKVPAICRSLRHERFVIDMEQGEKARDSGGLKSADIQLEAEDQVGAEGRVEDTVWPKKEKGGQRGKLDMTALPVHDNERSSVEKEVAEHLAHRLGSDMTSSQLNFQDPEEGSSADAANAWTPHTSEWLNLQNQFGSTRNSCPFFQDLDQSKCLWKGTGLSECEGASQSGVSSLNSGEDGDSETETEGDSESYTREKAKQMQLPFTVDWIVDLSRNDFQQLLKQQVFTREQLDFVHDMRRRSKNRLAAQRCRKRKLDCIYNLQCEIDKLKTEREKLMLEKSQLSQLKLKTCHTVSSLCQRVCNEANLKPEQLQ